LDIVEEYSQEEDQVQVIIPDLDYGKANLVVAAPNSWIHVSNVYDLADLVARWQSNTPPRNLRIACKYKRLTEKFLHQNNIYNYSLVDVSGVLEIAPKLKIADIIVDLTSTGTTLRENHLKEIDGGLILKSEACLIGYKKIFTDEGKKIQPVVEQIIDRIESYLRAREFVRVMGNIACENPKKVKEEISEELVKQKIDIKSSMLSHSLASSNGGSEVVNISLIINEKDIYKVVRCLRSHNAKEIASVKIDYLFLEESGYYQKAFI